MGKRNDFPLPIVLLRETILIYFGSHAGLGIHPTRLTPQQIDEALEWSVLVRFIYIIVNFIIRISGCHFTLRLFRSNAKRRWVLYFITGLIIVTNVTSIAMFLF